MTDIDLRKPDKEVIEADNIELIKEARAKIKPVIKAMSDEEVNAICMTLEEAKDKPEEEKKELGETVATRATDQLPDML